MWRGALLFGAFVVVSPVFRGYLFDAYGALEHAVNQNKIIAFAGTGMLGFVSFLAVRLTARK